VYGTQSRLAIAFGHNGFLVVNGPQRGHKGDGIQAGWCLFAQSLAQGLGPVVPLALLCFSGILFHAFQDIQQVKDFDGGFGGHTFQVVFLHFGPGVSQIFVTEKEGSFLTIAGHELLQLGELSLHAVGIKDRDTRISLLGLHRPLGSLRSLAVSLFAAAQEIQAFQGRIAHDGHRGVLGGIVPKQPHTFLKKMGMRRQDA
jgi:hypothetical protein